jgi:hypothetical protein
MVNIDSGIFWPPGNGILTEGQNSTPPQVKNDLPPNSPSKNSSPNLPSLPIFHCPTQPLGISHLKFPNRTNIKYQAYKKRQNQINYAAALLRRSVSVRNSPCKSVSSPSATKLNTTIYTTLPTNQTQLNQKNISQRLNFYPYLEQKHNNLCWKRKRTLVRFKEYFLEGDLKLALSEAKRITALKENANPETPKKIWGNPYAGSGRAFGNSGNHRTNFALEQSPNRAFIETLQDNTQKSELSLGRVKDIKSQPWTYNFEKKVSILGTSNRKARSERRLFRFDGEEGEGSLNGTKDSHLGDGYGERSGDCDRCAGEAGAGMKEREEVMSGVDGACGTDLLVSYFFSEFFRILSRR